MARSSGWWFGAVLSLVACGEEASSGAAASGGAAGSGASAGAAGTSAGGSGAGGASGSGSGGASGASGSGAAGAAGWPTSSERLTFVALGDSGYSALDDLGITRTAAVAALVHSLEPDFVVHLGDLNYPDGEASTAEANIGRHWGRYIAGYTGPSQAGGPTNRFFPTPGNHDYNTNEAQAYLDFIPFLAGRRYYEVDLGLLHLFSLDSEHAEGRDQASPQGQWALSAIAASTACFKLVFFHRPPYTSGRYNDSPNVQARWDYAALGVDAVLSGHDHLYERLTANGTPFLVVGSGGAGLYSVEAIQPESQFRYENYGALRGTVTRTELTFEFIALDGTVQDTFVIPKQCE